MARVRRGRYEDRYEDERYDGDEYDDAYDDYGDDYDDDYYEDGDYEDDYDDDYYEDDDYADDYDDYGDDDYYDEPVKKSRKSAQKAAAVKAVKPKKTAKKASAKKGAKKGKKSGKGSLILMLIEIPVLLFLIFFIWRFLMPTLKAGHVKINESDIVVNEGVAAKEGYRNIALFGVDATNGRLDRDTRSDTIIIASINEGTGEIRLCSVYRDTYLNLGNDRYFKCNSSYANGGPELAINMLNMNLDLDITDFVTVGFQGLTDAIDALGGIEIDVKENEIDHLNNYQLTIARDLNRDYTKVTSPGRQNLNGLQATAYCRIRYIAGGDLSRARHQREVLTAVLEKAKTASPSALEEAARSVFPNVLTSFDLDEILSLIKDVNRYQVTQSAGFPFDADVAGSTLYTIDNIGKASCIVPLDVTDNVVVLHRFLFDDAEYQVSEDVQRYSDEVKRQTAPYL